ncbi:MAG: NAD-dependent epimerase/dehydratase family protein [Rhodospirillaceae bacterium]|nr:NAD-dependent epimerase/dehydratase family protein [Rhodospirillaceae bacterium]MBT5373742.1 NAD-dependent epimerase/dehydratase family protein [Rhodospirillaceae bacterium]MBT5660114.1 NAD-dependent epimerase/dehydratase family protein [Rhodospirillaceae bacterium]MBT5752193.1 NAD-dependent epimerase/dehydratase family protein [Rhodospirillaceae bacterium]
MTILITGASGFVGAAVLRALIEAGHDVRAMVRPQSDRRNLEGLNVEIVIGDLRDADSLKAAVAGCEALFHVAADYRLWAPNPQEIIDSNVTGTRNIMEAALNAGVSRIVYTSSVATLGLNADGSPSDEATPVSLDDMIGAYKRSKFLAEEVVREMVAEKGLAAVIVNPAAPIGPRDIRPTPTGRMIVQAAAGKMPAFVDTGLNIVHVDDVARGHLLAFERGEIGERYVLGAENATLREILGEIAQITGRRPPTVNLPHNLVLPIAYIAEAFARLTGGPEPMVTVDGLKLSRKHMFFSIDKARAKLGYAPRPATEALVDAIEWFKANDYL